MTCRPAVPANPRELRAAEQVLLGATRLWTANAASAEAAYRATARYFGLFGLEQAARSHATVMHHSALAATRPLSIRGLRDPELAPDEARIAHAVGHAQADRMRAARRELASWLTPAAVRLTAPALAALAAAMAARGLVVQVRPWRTELSAPAAVAAPPTSSLVH